MVATVEKSENVHIVLGTKRVARLYELTALDWTHILDEALRGLYLVGSKDFQTPLQMTEDHRFGMQSGYRTNALQGELRSDARLLNCGWASVIPNQVSWPHVSGEQHLFVDQTEEIVVLDCTRSERVLRMLVILWSRKDILGEPFIRAEKIAARPFHVEQILSKYGADCLLQVIESMRQAQQRVEEDFARQKRLAGAHRERLSFMLDNIVRRSTD